MGRNKLIATSTLPVSIDTRGAWRGTGDNSGRLNPVRVPVAERLIDVGSQGFESVIAGVLLYMVHTPQSQFPRSSSFRVCRFGGFYTIRRKRRPIPIMQDGNFGRG